MKSITLSDGSKSRADAFVFACGPWLNIVFPDVVGKKIHPTRQEVFFFGTPAGDRRYYEDKTPVWVDFGEKLMYGIPGNERRGMKIADDSRGPDFDPTTDERTITQEGLNAARSFIEYRFPGLKGAPLVESRVCQYENSPDGNFIVDRHPSAKNVWIVGGGSGHGFKMGPALGDYVADVVLQKKEVDPFFSLTRLTSSS
jgi:glycine/D-amino acid oxidase-like deaminating enzyme